MNNKSPLETDYQKYIHLSKYSRWNYEKERRETWEETVWRWCRYWYDKEMITFMEALEFFEVIHNLEVMPSMRSLMTAGRALDVDNMAGYNCSYLAIEGKGKEYELTHQDLDEKVTIAMKSPVDFDELLYILTCGTGAGFSVERQYINNLPTIGKVLSRHICRRTNHNYPGVVKDDLSHISRSKNEIIVEDSKYGWASGLRILITELYNGNFEIRWNLHKIRPAGAILKTFGGRASGPDPLHQLFRFVKELFIKANGRKLNSLEVHDICCKIAQVVVVGSVRRSALISLSNLSDIRMREAKSGEWWREEGQRALSNNSVCYTEKPDITIFMEEWLSLMKSGSGERGIFNRYSAKKKLEKLPRRKVYEVGVNPCGEILLQSNQVCNLSEVIIRENDTYETLQRKVYYATIFGTLQSTLTDFVYLRPIWKQKCEEERLLGVSLTGIMDNKSMSNNSIFVEGDGEESITNVTTTILPLLKGQAIETNKRWVNRLGINQSTAITTCKPSGTVSQLVNSSSGIHPRFSKYYLRTVRADKKDPLSKFMVNSGIYHEDDVTNKDQSYVFYFPIKSPEGAILADEVSALDQLELYEQYSNNWTEHSVSITVYVKPDEWLTVGSWVYENWDDITGGLTFLPYSEHVYEQAPYQQITKEEYEIWLRKSPSNIDWSTLSDYEKEDYTVASSELACTSGVCEL